MIRFRVGVAVLAVFRVVVAAVTLPHRLTNAPRPDPAAVLGALNAIGTRVRAGV